MKLTLGTFNAAYIFTEHMQYFYIHLCKSIVYMFPVSFLLFCFLYYWSTYVIIHFFTVSSDITFCLQSCHSFAILFIYLLFIFSSLSRYRISNLKSRVIKQLIRIMMEAKASTELS